MPDKEFRCALFMESTRVARYVCIPWNSLHKRNSPLRRTNAFCDRISKAISSQLILCPYIELIYQHCCWKF